MPFATHGNHALYYEDTGGDLPVIAFSHGLLMDRTMFAPQLAVLRDHYRCIAWDERGHGQSATARLPPFSYYDSAEDLVHVLRHAGVERAVLVGMSQGGYLSLRLALRHPEIVRALILIDTQALPETPRRIQGYQNLVAQWTSDGLSDAAAVGIADTILGPGWSGAQAWTARWQAMLSANVAGAFETLCARDDISGYLPQITVPVLTVHGAGDRAIPIEKAQAMVDALPQGRPIVAIPGAGHAPNLTHPDIVNSAILAFLGALPA